MPVNVINFTTGPSTLPDTGLLSYNGCIFSPLFVSKVSGDPVKDNAQRTVKYMKYTIEVDGYVTQPTGAASISGVMNGLRELLTKQAGNLVYRGRGFDLEVNPGGTGGTRDVAWGPIPELLEFSPFGGGHSAKVVWKVTVCVPEVPTITTAEFRTDRRGRITAGRVLQFNYETSVEYTEDGYCTQNIRGTLEVPMTRSPSQSGRTLTYTVDSFRVSIESQILSKIDLSRFRITHRKFDVSRDKRTLDWELTAEEKPYMDSPPDCTIARGTYNVKPSRVGYGLARFLCTLRATYVVRADRPKRTAWLAFLALWRLRMGQANFATLPDLPEGAELRTEQHNPDRFYRRRNEADAPSYGPRFYSDQLGDGNRLLNIHQHVNAMVLDFGFEEGLYLDSKTITFHAAWTLPCTLNQILIASGLWKKLPEKDQKGDNAWASSMLDISGSQSWLASRLDPRADVIIDFGGP